mgnify:CR=1 FL=1
MLEFLSNTVMYSNALISSPNLSLQFASDKLKNNYKIVSHAVENHGWSLKYVSHKFQNNYKLNFEPIVKKNIGGVNSEDKLVLTLKLTLKRLLNGISKLLPNITLKFLFTFIIGSEVK